MLYPDQTTFLFVYGSLMQGMEHHSLLQGAPFWGAAWIRARLYDLGPYPGVIPGDGRVQGELYRIPVGLLARLDAFEDWDPRDPEGSLYRRESAVAHPLDGRPQVEAWVYFYNRQPPATGFVPHGDWRRHHRERSRRLNPPEK